MAAALALCTLLGVAHPAWDCDDPAIAACELAVKGAVNAPETYQRTEAAIPEPGREGAARVRLQYAIRNASGQATQSVAECFFSANATCLLPDGSYSTKCFQLSSVRIDGRFVSDKLIARSAGERSKAGVVIIKPRDTQLVATGAAAPGAQPKPFPVYEVTAKGLDDYGPDYGQAERLWASSPDSAREACAREVKQGDRPYRSLSECLSRRLKLAE